MKSGSRRQEFIQYSTVHKKGGKYKGDLIEMFRIMKGRDKTSAK